jgi:hypothetical protein
MGNGAVCRGKRFVWARLVVGLGTVLAFAFATANASAVGATYYASPDGTGTVCSQAAPCSIGMVVTKAGNGDSVSLASVPEPVPEADKYTLPFGGFRLEKGIDFGARPGAPAVLVTESGALRVTTDADSTMHDLRIEGTGGLELGSGVATRVFVAHQGVVGDACELDKGTTMRDSVCWTQETTDEDEGVSHAIDISSFGENQDEPVVLRNVTAFAENEIGSAIYLFSNASAVLTVDAANVIAKSVNGTDIVAALGESGLPKAHLNISHSSFGEFADDPPDAAVTPLGTAGNIAATPIFIDAANGNFHVDGESPTLDGGIADSLVGSIDLDGNDRAQAGCLGANPVPDMGAYERTPTATCPPPPPPPPPPFEPRKPVFRIVSLSLNKKAGTGRLLVEVPGAGTLSLTGSGVKLVRRTAPAGGGVISLPIQTWAITKVRLAKLGKARVRLKVIFEARAGGVEEWSKAVLLRKKRTT